MYAVCAGAASVRPTTEGRSIFTTRRRSVSVGLLAGSVGCLAAVSSASYVGAQQLSAEGICYFQPNILSLDDGQHPKRGLVVWICH